METPDNSGERPGVLILRFVKMDVTLSELRRATPHGGTGAPARSRSHYAAILQLLRERAEQGLGVLGSELYARPDLYGRSPRNRISELRRDGYLIEGKPRGSADWSYWLIRDNAGQSYPASQHGEARPAQSLKPETAWKDRKPVTGLELFDAAVR
jgi:hypothetical protein